MMWPSDFAIQNCIKWNRHEHARAMHDLSLTSVPPHAHKIVWEGKNQKKVQLTIEEFRALRAKDAERFRSNIETLLVGPGRA